MTTRSTVHVGKRPRQQRSQLTRRRILDAALRVLARAGIEALTTNRIAEEADISVASLYQFFPNKQSVVYAAYQDWVAELSASVKAICAEGMDADARGQNWRALANRLADALGARTISSKAEYELLRAMWSHRDLIEVDRAHIKALAECVAECMIAAGSRLPRDHLITLAGLANEVFTLAAQRNGVLPAKQQTIIGAYARVAYLALWQAAMSPKTLPKSPD